MSTRIIYHKKSILLILGIFLSSISQSSAIRKLDGKLDLDPVIFKIEASKLQVVLNEEFEIKITATRRPNWDFRLGNSTLTSEFYIKVTFPEGFIQTGGNYSDYISDGFQHGKSHVVFKIKGKFTTTIQDPTFILLRGTKQSIETGRYLLYKGQIKVRLISKTEGIKISQSKLAISSFTGCTPNKVRLIFRLPGECCMERLIGAKIQGSNNGTDWSDLYTFDKNGTGTLQEFTSPNFTSYTSLRFVASNSGWGEIAELEFYNGSTRLVGTPFGQGNYILAFDGASGTKWEGTSAGSSNIIGLNITGCGDLICVPPATPTISISNGTTVCSATNQQVTLSASGTNGTVRWFRSGTQVGTGPTLVTSDPGTYTATCESSNACVSEASNALTVSQTGGCSVTPGTLLGTYTQTVGDRTYTYNRTPEFEIQFGLSNLSDITPNLDQSGAIHKLNGSNVFYAIGNYPLENSTGTPQMFQNIYLQDGIYTIAQYVCQANKVPDFNTFKTHFEGWNGQGVNADNCRYSKIFLSIKSSSPQGNTTVPSWLVVTRQLTWPKNATTKNWRDYKKFHAIGGANRNANKGVYHTGGVNTYFSGTTIEPNSWRTDRLAPNAVDNGNPYATPPTDSELYSLGQSAAILHGNNINAIYSEEYEENTQGHGGDINFRSVNQNKGFYDQIRQATGETDAQKMGAFGGYGGDDYGDYNVFGSGLDKPYNRFVESLTNHLYDHYHPASDTWFGTANYYASGAINYRNLNHKLYYYNKIYQTPYNLIYLNERIKLGTKSYQGQDRERNIVLFTSPLTESFVADFTSGIARRNNIEIADTGELIPFPNGEMISKSNSQPPAPWDQMFTDCLWATIINGGVLNWDAGSVYGGNAAKFHFWGDGLAALWKPTGSTNFSQYSSNQNGAPVNDSEGLSHRLSSTPIDAQLAAMEVAWSIRDKIQTIKHIAYTSTRGNFIPIPGSSGLLLNGFGPINNNQFNIYNIYNQKKGIALETSGSAGGLIIYYNGFLSPHLYEDVTVKNHTFRAYGRSTVIIND
ncbi:hypothetical protein DYBT9275_00096 [Dyadobacter sp. CECT 9275]|uniref:Uncharacterized protein n=1 Tax=Dyadobacter helix TaxID=2822344 RepID=A0A916J8R5_9BACT|nr:hypothetical protein [Dyadobacter sp. CECT 9275]CAG4988506.1 hypothetical protein DYBT9275_00096 [Dyadobacter sp. CECT 9275]